MVMEKINLVEIDFFFVSNYLHSLSFENSPKESFLHHLEYDLVFRGIQRFFLKLLFWLF